MTKKVLFSIIALVFFNFIHIKSQIIPISGKSVSSEIQGWPKDYLTDGIDGTVWSSNTHSTAANAENVTINFANTSQVNFVKLMPRYVNGTATGFPKSFKIQYRSTSVPIQFTTIRIESDFPLSKRNENIILSFPQTINTKSIRITADELGQDNVGNFVFQLGEISAGYDDKFEIFKYVNNNSQFKSSNTNEIRGTSASAFNPNHLAEWHFDVRKPLLDAPNIYAPSIVKDNGSNWKIFYGGWDYANSTHDNIYNVQSNDNFSTFTNKSLVVSNLPYKHANNASVIKDNNKWKMLYTVLKDTIPNNRNTTFYGTSDNGLIWNFNYEISMSNYNILVNNTIHTWQNADVNGSNVLFKDDAGLYHMYFINYDIPNFHVFHATSPDFINYNYVGIAQEKTMIPNDLKSFQFNNQKKYLLASHLNNDKIELTLSDNLNSFPVNPNKILSEDPDNPNDQYITSVGLISDNNILMGLMYGASSNSQLMDNKIYAAWLQKKVIFKNNFVQWGDRENAYGPDTTLLYLDSQVETGKFYIYDEGTGTIPIFESPEVTMKSGDIWNFINYGNTGTTIRASQSSDKKSTLIPDQQDSILFYPNPSKDKIYLNTDIDYVEIYDSKGALVDKKKVSDKEISISHLKPDIYFIILFKGKQKIQKTLQKL